MGWRIALALLWLTLVCYPDPRVLARSTAHTLRPPIDPAGVRDWALTLPNDPAQIEAAVLERVRYAVPWQKDGVPWTFPAPAEILATGYGDCQGRAVVFASILAAKGISFQLRASVDHMWVEYRGKQPTVLENEAKTLWTRQERVSRSAPTVRSVLPTGVRFKLPQMNVGESVRIEKEYLGS